MADSKYLSVTALNKYIQAKFTHDPYLNQTVYLTGEISNFRQRPVHQYFSLKDDHSKISAVMFKGAFSKLKFRLEEGMKVLVCGRVSTYPVSGQYQIYIDRMEPDGVGQLYQALEQLKKQLSQEGLFRDEHKQPLPIFPKKIAIITSPSGAVIKDIIKTVHLRYPIVQLVLYPTVVQGDKAADDIVRQIHRVEATHQFDTLIIGRGGGSIEDLWPFNEERVARAIYDCKIPVISSVGHQTDYTIADYVADQRAATPTAAAEFAVPVLSQVLLTIDNDYQALVNYFSNLVHSKHQLLKRLQKSYILQNPERIYEGYVQRVDIASERLVNLFKQRLNRTNGNVQQAIYRLNEVNPHTQVVARGNQLRLLDQRLLNSMRNIVRNHTEQYQHLTSALQHFSPNQIMKRGYSYVTKDGQVVNSVNDLAANDSIMLNLYDGQVEVKVSQIRKD